MPPSTPRCARPGARRISTILSALAMLAGALVNQAAAVTINFNDGVHGLAVGNFYAPQGVTFSANTLWDNFVSPGEELVGAGGLKIQANSYQPTPQNPIVATFSGPLSHFQIRSLNVGENGVRIEAYDAAVGGNLIAFDQAFGIDFGVDNHPLMVASATPIRRVHMFQPAAVSTEGMLFDNMEFRFVPEPSSAVLLVLAGGVLGISRRRR